MIALRTKDDELVWLARKCIFIRELPDNRGQRVEGIQRWCGGTAGQSWCCHFATWLLDLVYEGQSPVPRTGSCDTILALATVKGWLRDTPVPGDLYLVLRTPDDAHHVGIVTEVAQPGRFWEVSGNTNTDGSDNGIGVFERERSIGRDSLVFVHYPRG